MLNKLTLLMRPASCRSPNPQVECWKPSCDGCPYSHSRFANTLQRSLLAATILFVTACASYDPYAAKFPLVGLGDNRARVIEVMGQPPDSVNSVEVPLVKAEQLSWRSPGKGRLYLVLMVMDRTAAKFSVD